MQDKEINTIFLKERIKEKNERLIRKNLPREGRQKRKKDTEKERQKQKFKKTERK